MVRGGIVKMRLGKVHLAENPDEVRALHLERSQWALVCDTEYFGSSECAMLNSYYVLRALALEWQQKLKGQVVQGVWTHAAGELCIALAHGDPSGTLTFLTHRPLIGAFVKPGIGQARRNRRSIFRQLIGQAVTEVAIVEGERVLRIHTTGHLSIEAYLFGPRANVFLIDSDEGPIARFRTRLSGGLPPLRPAAMPDSLGAFMTLWAQRRNDFAPKALASVFPFFDRTLAQEALLRSGLDRPEADRFDEKALARLYQSSSALHQELLEPSPCLYRNPLALAPRVLQSRSDAPAELFDSMGSAARAFAQQALAECAFRVAFEPRQKALVARLGKAHRTVERLRAQKKSKDKETLHRRFADLLMAAGRRPTGLSHLELPDLFQGGAPLKIPLNPALDSLQNAERYYEKSRNARLRRKHLDALLANEQSKVLELQKQLDKLQAVRTVKGLKALDAKGAKTAATAPSGPFKRFRLTTGYELWVGRNAKESELLTMRHARPFDLWLHARGVSGAHAVLRLPSRQDKPAVWLLERAAEIVAWHSKARGSAIVPVIVTPRKYVRKARGGATGAMVVMREEQVLLVEPALP